MFLCPNLLTVKSFSGKNVVMVTQDTPQDAPAGDSSKDLSGTPVVPGLAYGPALLVRSEVSESAIAAYGDGGHADADAALAAYQEAAAAVATGFESKASRASGAAAEVLTASAGLARDKGLQGGVKKRLARGSR